MGMILRRKEFPQPSIDCLGKTESGQISWTMGLLLTLLLAVYLFASLQTQRFRTASLYMEDALAASNLASAVVDYEEYGISHVIRIADPERSYGVYQNALRGNLNLDENFRGNAGGVICGNVTIENYTVYNVDGLTVSIHEFTPEGETIREERLGAAKAPNGLLIEFTSIYSEISFPLEVIHGVEVIARKGKLVDIAGNREGG